MYKLSYNATTGEIIGFYPEPYSDYSSIPEPNIEITNDQWLDCINHQGLRRVDLTTLQIVEYTPPGPSEEEQKNAALDTLNFDYAVKLERLAYSASKPEILAAAGIISQEEATANKAAIVTEYARLAQELRQKQNQIIGGAV